MGAIAVVLVSGAAHADPPVLLVERIAAIVGTEAILESEVAARVAVGGDASPGRAAVLQQLIDARLVAAEAHRKSVQVSAAEVDQAIARIKAQNGLDDDALSKALAEQGYTMEAYRGEIAAQLLQYRVFITWISGRLRVTDAEIEHLYRERGETRPLAEVRDELYEQLYAAKTATEMTRWLAGLRAATYVELR